MQIRDKRTLGIDTLFPIALIIMGLWLATLAIFKDGVPRTMRADYIYPPVNTLYYNYDSDKTDIAGSMTTPDDIKNFVEKSIVD